MSSDESQKDPGFTVRDNRSAAPEDAGDLPSIDFSTFVLSLATSALFHMGLGAHIRLATQCPTLNSIERRKIL